MQIALGAKVKVGADKNGLIVNGQQFTASGDELDVEHAPSRAVH